MILSALAQESIWKRKGKIVARTGFIDEPADTMGVGTVSWHAMTRSGLPVARLHERDFVGDRVFQRSMPISCE